MTVVRLSDLKQKIRVNLSLYVCFSLVLGIIGIACSTYIIHRYHWSNTNYGISDCRVQTPTDPTEIVRGNASVPPFTGCTGVKVGWPAAFAQSDVEVSIGVNNPKTPVPINELFGLGNIFLSLPKFLLDWILWSALGFAGIVIFISTKRK